MRVSVLIVSWNARDWLARCLGALLDTPHEVIVVDNASADGSAALVRRDFPAVRLVESSTNLGFAGGVNLARRQATSPLLLLLNPDTVPAPGAIDRLAHALASPAAAGSADMGAADVGAVAGRLVDEQGRPQAGFNIRRLPTVASLLVDLLLVDHLWPNNPVSSLYYARDFDPDAPADVEQPAAACLMVRADLFDRLGGLDERFHPAWFEDVDFCRRLRESGHRIRYEPAATFAHRGGVARDTLGPQAFSRTFYRNLLRYVRKHHGLPSELAVRSALAAGMLPRAVTALVRGDRASARASLSAWRDAALWWPTEPVDDR
jgi:N-acetylglucosaminyl-diphospho-decaprenol L-rhamnosyltransferase